MDKSMLGSRIRKLREQEGFSQEEFGKRFGLTKYQVSRYESGASDPSSDLIIKFSTFFEVTTDYLLGKSTDPRITEEQEKRIDADVERTMKILEEADEEDRIELETMMRLFVQMKKEERERKAKERR